MCPDHWRLCPKELRNEVWRYYRAGQEKTGGASPMYFDAARAAIAHVEKEERIASAVGVQTQPSLFMSQFVRFAGQPIKFNDIANARLIAEVVPVSMATIFVSLDDAMRRASAQWGDAGLEHVEFCRAGVEPQRRRGAEVLADGQKELL